MKIKLKNFWNYVKAHPKRSVLALVVVGLVVWGLTSGGSKNYIDAKVVKGDLVSDVAVTGKTKAVESVNLGFDVSGRVASSPVSVGDRVNKGDILARLDDSQLEADLAKARATLAEENVTLAETRNDSADTYSDARLSAIAAIKNAYSKSDDVIHNSIDQFFKNPRQYNTYVDFSFDDGTYSYTFPLETNLSIAINGSRASLEGTLSTWSKSVVSLNSSVSDLTPYLTEAENNLSQVRSFLDLLATGVNSLVSSDFSRNATIASYKDTVGTARATINTALDTLLTAKAKISSAPKIISDTGVGSSGFDDVLAQEAKVAQAQASVKSAEAQIAKTIIYSPISGVVTKQDAKVGQIVTSGTELVSVISDNNLEIEANVSEVNIGKINVGNKVDITFDAFPGKHYTGTLFYIDPGETIVDGVVNYKVKVSLDGDVQDIKSGLTANLSVETGRKEGVLYVPQFAVTENNGKFTVDKVEGGKTVTVPVTVGFSSSDGNVEVVSGLNEGESVRFSK